MSCSTSELPPDLTVEILSRLSVKSLVRFKSVCKLWLSLIESSRFVSRHLNRSINNCGGDKDRYGGRYLLVKHRRRDSGARLISLLSTETLELIPPVDIPPHVDAREFNVIGSCNGILCCASDSGWPIFFWNPATRKSRVLPGCMFSRGGVELPESLCVFAHGFGYDCVVDDYKLVRIAFFHLLNKPCFRAEVFAVSEGSWREVPALACRVYSSGCTAVNGILYWVAYNCGSDDQELILSFNLRDEVFGRVYMPDSSFIGDGNCTKLSVYQESLCLIVYNFRGRSKCLDLWMMSDGARQHCWTKQLSIGPIIGVHKPLGYGINGEIFMEKNNGTLVIYDAENEAVQDLPVKGFPYSLDCHFYIESLVSVGR
ncbi:hypothetical protein SAY86_022651 [Trapa natans]|uniref:F-box domain-containing protein n=1 Tax=Trapa natans TaxID=22666 RepID=A0AAN7M944_TRANT|nr:hypothetical protein SAY86_022651 [Trapa natans]